MTIHLPTINGFGGNGGGGGASFPTIVTDSGSSLPSASGYQLNDTFLNTSDKKIYKAEVVNYSLASDITNVGSLDVSTNEISGFSSTKYLSSNRYNTSINNINIHFKTGEDVSSEQVLLWQGEGPSFSALTNIEILNKRLNIENTHLYADVKPNTEYRIKGYISKNNDDNKYYFYATLEENGVVVATDDCLFNIVETSSQKYTYFGIFRSGNSLIIPFLGTIYGDTNFLGTILVANLSWDSGTDLTDKTEYTDKTNGILYLYQDTELIQIPQNKNLVFTNVSASSWISDSAYTDYGYKCELSCSGVTASMYAMVNFAPTEADSGNYATVCLTGTDTVTIYSKVNDSITIPTIVVMGV